MIIVSFVEAFKYSVLNEVGIQRSKAIYHHLNKVCFIEWVHRQNKVQAAEKVRCQRKQGKKSFTFTGMLLHAEQRTWSYKRKSEVVF